MGILDSGISGGFRKKIGPNIGRRHMGQDLVLPLYHPTTKKPTQAQLSECARFGLLNSFLRDIAGLVEPGFKKQPKKKRSPKNAAFSYNYGHAFLPDGEGWALNYPALLYSRGEICTPDGLTISRNGDLVSFNWPPQPQSSYCQFSDLASFLAYCPEKRLVLAERNASRRDALVYELELPEGFSGVLHCYMSFASADGKLVGDSVYAGQVGTIED